MNLGVLLFQETSVYTISCLAVAMHMIYVSHGADKSRRLDASRRKAEVVLFFAYLSSGN